MTIKSPFDGNYRSSSRPVSSQDNETVELFYSWVRKGQITDVRIISGVALYGRVQRFRNWLHNRAPWLPSWVTGWVTIRYQRPTKPVSDAN